MLRETAGCRKTDPPHPRIQVESEEIQQQKTSGILQLESEGRGGESGDKGQNIREVGDFFVCFVTFTHGVLNILKLKVHLN